MDLPLDFLKKIHNYFIDTKQSLCVVESCTGGLLSFWLTHLPHSSQYFVGGLVSYATQVKIKELGLDPKQIEEQGLVTKSCASSMAQGVKNRLKTSWALSITGIAGPSKGALGEPVGKVAFSLHSPFENKSIIKHFKNLNRKDMRHQATLFSLDFLISGFK